MKKSFFLLASVIGVIFIVGCSPIKGKELQSTVIIEEADKTKESPMLHSPVEDCKKISYEGKTYKTVAIGGKCWMAENLNAGKMIPITSEAQDNGEIEKYCLEDSEANCEKYGALYQWPEAMGYTEKEGSQGICPKGWHIPTQKEVENFIAVFGTKSGIKAREKNSCEETDASACGKDEKGKDVGFNLLLNGFRHSAGESWEKEQTASFWTSTKNMERDDNVGYYALMGKKSQVIIAGMVTYLTEGRAIRCIRD